MTLFFIDANFEKLQYYIYSFGFILLITALLFVFYPPFKKVLITYIKNHKFFISVFSLFYLLYIVVRLFYFDKLFAFFYAEDGFFENLTAIFFLIAAGYFVLTFLKVRKSVNTWVNLFLIGLVVSCFFVGMEEISWGQRILGIDTPEKMKELNHQGETTLHNLIHERFYYEIYMVFTICCIVFFCFSHTKYTTLFGVPQSYLPSKKFLVISLLLPCLLFFNMEHYEVILAFMFLVYSYQLYKKKITCSRPEI